MFEKTRVVYHFHDMAMHHSRLATFYSGASPGAALCAQPSALRGEGSSFNLTIRLILMDRLQGTTRVSLLQFPNQTLSPSCNRDTSLLQDIMKLHFLHRTNSFRHVPISHWPPKISGGSIHWSTDHPSKATKIPYLCTFKKKQH